MSSLLLPKTRGNTGKHSDIWCLGHFYAGKIWEQVVSVYGTRADAVWTTQRLLTLQPSACSAQIETADGKRYPLRSLSREERGAWLEKIAAAVNRTPQPPPRPTRRGSAGPGLLGRLRGQGSGAESERRGRTGTEDDAQETSPGSGRGWVSSSAHGMLSGSLRPGAACLPVCRGADEGPGPEEPPANDMNAAYSRRAEQVVAQH